MNTYSAKFWATCPANGLQIDYSLTIKTRSMIRVEELQAHLEGIKSGFHEHIADELLKAFGGLQVLSATHHGVGITTERGSEVVGGEG